MELQPIIEFLTQWAYAPATLVIGVAVWLIKSQGWFDLGKMQWTVAVGLGVIFGVIQKMPIFAFLGWPIQAEWAQAILMGLATGFMAILAHTMGKNTKQAIANWLHGKQ